nr:ATP-binding protein [Miltoncostaea marina]
MDVAVAGDAATALGSHAPLLQLCTNLVRDGIVHNLPQGGTVRVTTGVRGGQAELVVESTGEPLAPELVATLAEPFRRGTDRVRTDHAGVGLGLAIVTGIAEAHDGGVELAPRAAGGLRATVRMPAAGAPAGG